MMDIRPLSAHYAVSPQIAADDLARAKALGFTDIIDNRPDAEIPAELHGPAMAAQAQALGLAFHINPVISGALSEANVAAQRAVMDAAQGPVLAYCASGNRSSIVWALAQRGQVAADDLIGAAAKAGYNLEHLRALLQG
jgi:uncharacterized protein (TIGR01244 family)